MTDKQAVIEVLNRLPETVTLQEIIEELQIMTSIRCGRADIAVGRSMGHDDVKKLDWTRK
jgi:hypothetical protein